MAVEGMVHALSEAQRVLKPGGRLLDLRPAAVHRRVGLARAGRFEWLDHMRETFESDRAADEAVRRALAAGLFRPEWRGQFECRRQMDTLAELHAFLQDFPQPDDWLVPVVAAALRRKRAAWKIVVSAPVGLRVLRKPAPSGRTA